MGFWIGAAGGSGETAIESDAHVSCNAERAQDFV